MFRVLRCPAVVMLPGSLLLGSCMLNSGDALSPAARPAVAPQTRGACPDLEGTFEELGRFVAGTASGRPCQLETGQCTSLSFALLEPANVSLVNRTPSDRATGVRIAQPADERLEITVLPDGPVRRLSLQDGDFSCGADGLSLRETSDRMIAVISNVHSTEVRTFTRAADGTLVMLSRWRNRGLHAFVTFDVRNEELVRWAPSPLSPP